MKSLKIAKKNLHDLKHCVSVAAADVSDDDLHESESQEGIASSSTDITTISDDEDCNSPHRSQGSLTSPSDVTIISDDSDY